MARLTQDIPAYNGGDLIGYIMEHGAKLIADAGSIRSITAVRDRAIIVTDYGVWLAQPDHGVGFSVQRLSWI